MNAARRAARAVAVRRPGPRIGAAGGVEHHPAVGAQRLLQESPDPGVVAALDRAVVVQILERRPPARPLETLAVERTRAGERPPGVARYGMALGFGDPPPRATREKHTKR